MESPSPTDPIAVDNVDVIVSAVVIGMAALLATLLVIAAVALMQEVEVCAVFFEAFDSVPHTGH